MWHAMVYDCTYLLYIFKYDTPCALHVDNVFFILDGNFYALIHVGDTNEVLLVCHLRLERFLKH